MHSGFLIATAATAATGWALALEIPAAPDRFWPYIVGGAYTGLTLIWGIVLWMFSERLERRLAERDKALATEFGMQLDALREELTSNLVSDKVFQAIVAGLKRR